MYQRLGAIPLMDQNLPMEAVESATRVQERERVMIAVMALAFGVLSTLLIVKRGASCP